MENSEERNYPQLLDGSIKWININNYLQLIEWYLKRKITSEELLESFMDLDDSFLELFDLFEVDSFKTILISELEEIKNKDLLIGYSNLFNDLTDELIYNSRSEFNSPIEYEIFERKFRIRLYKILSILKS